MSNSKTKILFDRRKERVRNKIKKLNYSNRIRLSIFRSGKHIYGQFIDDVKGITIACASSLDKSLNLNTGSNIKAASEVGFLLADAAIKANITLDQIVFDRGGYLFHGRVKALVDAVCQKLN
ncbi:MAG: 50S ribosomal protein L18 [Rickettsiales bacterium]|nr:MAG: 50S ribosomal protein L18 [Rickettsiales bacterium]